MIVVVVAIVLQDRIKMYVTFRMSNSRCGTAVFGKKEWGDWWLGIGTMFHERNCGAGQRAILAFGPGVGLSMLSLRIFERLKPMIINAFRSLPGLLQSKCRPLHGIEIFHPCSVGVNSVPILHYADLGTFYQQGL
jgi:hypothetical protein